VDFLDLQIPELKTGESIDRLGYHGLRIIQNPAKFKFTMDAFLLAGFIEPKPAHKIIDLGSGGGVLPLLIAGQRKVASVLGVEIQPELVEMSRRSAVLNGLANIITFETADLRNLSSSFMANSFDYVITNPPFFERNRGVISENPGLASAKFEINCTLEDVAKSAARCVKANGKVAIIYPSERFDDLMFVFQKYHLTPKRICFIHSKNNVNSNLVLMEAKPGAKKGVGVLPPITIYETDGSYTGTMERIFHGENYSEILYPRSGK
jgi:tRNA1Val (adenine37-N6)-methyltransferase